MKFSAQTFYDKERLLRYNNFVILRRRFFWAVMIVCTALVTICLAVGIVLDPYDYTTWLYPAILYVIDVTYIFCNFVLPRFTVNKSLSINTNLTYEFQEDTFKVLATSKNAAESSELNYSAIVKVMESKQDIYLFVSKRQGLILDKSGFTVGTSEDFLKFLHEKNIPYKK